MNPMIIITLIQVVSENLEREHVFEEARATANSMGKPLLNAGCGALTPIGGYPRAIYESDVNLDAVPQKVPRFVLASIEEIPYPTKYFGAAFCSHALEHVENYELAVLELHRVAYFVYIIVPESIWPSSWLHLGHRRVFRDGRVIPLD